jgi:hypothetical protein
VLVDWEDLIRPGAKIEGLTVDFAAQLGQSFCDDDLIEEPYLAFAVASDDTLEGIIAKCNAILRFRPPSIQPFI